MKKTYQLFITDTMDTSLYELHVIETEDDLFACIGELALKHTLTFTKTVHKPHLLNFLETIIDNDGFVAYAKTNYDVEITLTLVEKPM